MSTPEHIAIGTSARHVLLELVHRGLIPLSVVIDGDAMIVSERSRHLIHVVHASNAGNFLIKQAQNWQPQARQTLHREALWYRFVHEGGNPVAQRLRPLLPSFHGYDREGGLLFLEYLHSAENLKAFHERTGMYPASIGARLGEALSALHSIDDAPYIAQLDIHGTPPWIFDLHKQQSTPYGLSGANKQLLAILERYSNLSSSLDRLKREWQPTALMHGDIKWENCLLNSPNDPSSEITLIDWEMLDHGDPLWDVAAIFQSYVTAWAIAYPESQHDENFDTAHSRRLEEMQNLTRSFWNSYSYARKSPPDSLENNLIRATEYAAARMIQTAFEHNVSVSQLSSSVMYVIQAAMNMLDRPNAAAESLLGILHA